MWFKNLTLFRLDNEWKITASELESQLADHPLSPCSGLSMESRGWLAPRDNGNLVESLDRHLLIGLGIEQKLLPASIVNQIAKDKAREMEDQQGYAPGRKQLRDIKERVTTELLPRAFSRRKLVRAWVDTANRWLVVDSAAPTPAEELVELLRDTADAAPKLRLFDVEKSPLVAMTQWLASGQAPGRFSIDDECELRGGDDGKSTVRYLRHALDGEEIRRHISSGKQVTRLALTWNDRVSFVLTETLQLKRVAFIDVQADDESSQAGDDSELQFEADFTLMTGELLTLLFELAEVLDTHLPRIDSKAVAA